ncbi:2-hydroxychromene-2-carboxylate isomerase [Zoogloea dura]|jgi:2-hydroxychromene-2-carboxylate isomerase|uniref:2-hydroxychromene-2-carboxylate isomerase n=1 Tax=Zoogloea dura TaxID=2728840 RepID=A0A848G7F4_9RHOO|nr:2-hydroxychromene-2-carboxylate isomerase [Zoogloea dura]NML27092.1 2-hydroxychromene-2-carboxylate isomerase [Zoogloea dura]
MTPATLYFDVVSPYAYIMDVLLRRASLPLEITLKPVLFAGLLKAHDNKGPAEIPRKRQYTYELCTWLAQRHDIPFRMPPVHPFNPIRYLRLIIALGSSRVVASAVFDSLYREGADPDDPRIWRALTVALGVAEPDARIEAAAVKLALRHNTEEAVAAGVFGVPTVLAGDRLFWGVDSLPMLEAWLAGDPALESSAMQAARQVRPGISRL